MTDAPTLFDQPNEARSRSTDPETTKVAGMRKDPAPDQADVLRVLRLAGVAITCEQVRSMLVEHLNKRRDRNEVASRLSELADVKRWPEQAPLARKVGTRKNHRGRDVATWALTVAGTNKAKELGS
jgi:hypothetical protein